MPTSKRFLYVWLTLVAVVFSIYGYLWHCGFIDFDDNTHVFENPHVRSGLTWENVLWAFTHFHGAQWIPITWVAHMVDVSLFGLDAGAHHMVAVALHAVNACLLLLALHRLTGAFWESAAVALLFAVHPLNVESVAWVAERKNLLSTLFWLLALIAYARHARRPGVPTMAAVLICMVAGLLCKGMLVTLPCVLLLLDFWPLERWRKQSWLTLVFEKLPLFAVSIASSFVTSRAAIAGNALIPTDLTPISYRIPNAIANYAIYFRKLIWPEDLAIIYPLPPEAPFILASLSASGIAVVLYMAWRTRTRAPYILVGSLWFLGVLVPVSGLVQVGKNVLADRFTYVPQIGLFVAVVWGISALLRHRVHLRRPALAIGTAVLFCLGLRSAAYVQHWTNTATIFVEAASAVERNFFAHAIAGGALAHDGHYQAALFHYKAALAANPGDSGTRTSLGIALSRLGNEDAALAQFQQALADNPSDVGARLNLATHLLKRKQTKAAISHLIFLTTTEEEPSLVHYWLGRAWMEAGDTERAVSHYRKALEAAPNAPRTREALAEAEARAARR